MPTLLLLLALTAQAQDGVVKLDTKKTHLSIFLSAKLFPIKMGPIVLNGEGLSVDDKLVCRWPDGKFDDAKAPNMILGYSSSAFVSGGPTEYRPCPTDVPVRSTWGDGGTGAAALYVEVERVEKDRAEIRFRGKTYHLTLAPLLGHYRVEPPNSLSNTPGD